jgi:glutamyl-tRNA reductase
MKRKCANLENKTGTWFLAVCGINHRTATIEERAPLALGHDEIPNAHLELANFENVYEAVAVSTCNRVEFYLVLQEGVEPFNVVKNFYRNFRKLDISYLESKFYTYKELLAVEHLFRVAGGLDSMVLGESQIFGQIKESYSSACMIKTAGKIIHRLFHLAFRTGKQVRTHTSLTEGANSVSGAAISLLKNLINGRKDIPILFIGVNQMIHIAATTLHKSGYNNFKFANRTESKAKEMAEKYGGSAYALSNLDELLASSEVVITCTGSPEPILDDSNLLPAVSSNGRKMIVMDMAIPRDTIPLPDHKDKIRIFDLEDIDAFLEETRKSREEAIPQAREIINRKLSEFAYWYEHAKSEPLVERVEHELERIRREEMAEITKDLDDETTSKIEEFSKRLINRLLNTNRRCKKGH